MKFKSKIQKIKAPKILTQNEIKNQSYNKKNTMTIGKQTVLKN